MFSLVKLLSLNNLGGSWMLSWAIGGVVAAFALVNLAGADSFVSLFNNVVRLSILVSGLWGVKRVWTLSIATNSFQLVWIFADAWKQLASLFIFTYPFCNIIVGSLFLQSFEYSLILHGDFEQFSLASFTVQTLLRLRVDRWQMGSVKHALSLLRNSVIGRVDMGSLVL